MFLSPGALAKFDRVEARTLLYPYLVRGIISRVAWQSRGGVLKGEEGDKAKQQSGED